MVIAAVLLAAACSTTGATGSPHVGTVTTGGVRVQPQAAPDQQGIQQLATPNPVRPGGAPSTQPPATNPAPRIPSIQPTAEPAQSPAVDRCNSTGSGKVDPLCPPM